MYKKKVQKNQTLIYNINFNKIYTKLNGKE